MSRDAGSVGRGCYVPNGEDRERYWRRFLEDSPRLFASEHNRLEVMRVVTGSNGEFQSNARPVVWL